jgi:NapH/MauN family ferredoxin-type protein
MKLAPRKLQILRRTVQITVLISLCLVPAVARYHNYVSAREIDRVIEKWDGSAPGEIMALLDGAFRALPGGETERAGSMQRDRDQVVLYAQQVRGSVWSANIGPLSLTDPLAVAESATASKKFPWVLAVGVFIPLLVTLIFGRVFCSWVCPAGFLFEMNDKLRGLLRVLELPPRNLRMARSTKYGLLLTGLGLTAVVAVPVLGYVYPPAVLGREIHDLVFAAFDRAEHGRFGFWVGGMSWMTVVFMTIVAIELFVSRRWWCRYVCPGGGLYSIIGSVRPFRVKLKHSACTECALCVAACPMGLNPMKNEMGMECDNCGVCISSCNDDALGYGIETIKIAKTTEAAT